MNRCYHKLNVGIQPLCPLLFHTISYHTILDSGWQQRQWKCHHNRKKMIERHWRDSTNLLRCKDVSDICWWNRKTQKMRKRTQPKLEGQRTLIWPRKKSWKGYPAFKSKWVFKSCISQNTQLCCPKQMGISKVIKLKYLFEEHCMHRG